jgi:hypothetical protein
MTGLAGIVPGMSDGPSRDLRDRRSTIMAVLTKAVRNNSGAQNDERHQSDDHDGCETDEVFRVFEQVRIPASNFGRVLRLEIAQCLWILCISSANDDRGHSWL